MPSSVFTNPNTLIWKLTNLLEWDRTSFYRFMNEMLVIKKLPNNRLLVNRTVGILASVFQMSKPVFFHLILLLLNQTLGCHFSYIILPNTLLLTIKCFLWNLFLNSIIYKITVVPSFHKSINLYNMALNDSIHIALHNLHLILSKFLHYIQCWIIVLYRQWSV